MKLFELFSSTGMQAFGWTLLHSLWQGLLCSMVVMLCLRCFPSAKAAVRYLIATAGLFLLLLTSIATFIYIRQLAPAHATTADTASYQVISYVFVAGHDVSIAPFFSMVNNFLKTNLAFIVITWAIGAIFFSVRVISGYWYIRRIRAGALYLETAWQDHIQALARRLGIDRSVGLAESLWIQAPVVIGYFKPMILLPIGMLSGLSAEQLESILIHELVHIRRSDYIINIIQSIIEALFFFNPFAWMLSSAIRREREHCCDDMVVEVYGNRLAYAHALARLEEAKLSRAGLALSLAENKNQLLNRIRRIMEKSVQRYSGREKVIPVVLLVLGLMCASWLTIQSERDNVLAMQEPVVQTNLVAQDTSKKNNTFHYSFKKTTTDDENAEVEDENNDEFSYDHDVTYYVDPIPAIEAIPSFENMDFEFEMPEVPAMAEMDFEVPVPPFPDFGTMDFTYLQHFDGDTLHPQTWNNQRDWDEFGKEFEKNFKEKFGDFYEKHEKDLKKIMEDVQEKFKSEGGEWDERMTELASRQAEIAAIQVERLNDVVAHRMQYERDREHMNEQRSRMEEERERMHNDARNMHERHNGDLKRLESDMRAMEKNMAEVKKELQKQLIKDGYLSPDDEINNIDVSDESIEINSKKIKQSDEKKYREIMKKMQQPVPGSKE